MMYSNLLDYNVDYEYVTESDWLKVFEYIYAQYKPPAAGKPGIDCDDYAFWLKGMVGAVFGINGCAFAIGDLDNGEGELRGRHALNMVWIGEGFKLWEPNPGFRMNKLFNVREGPMFFTPRYILM